MWGGRIFSSQAAFFPEDMHGGDAGLGGGRARRGGQGLMERMLLLLLLMRMCFVSHHPGGCFDQAA